jgi:DNA-binding TFAR19-related protein (PDSD5 family)
MSENKDNEQYELEKIRMRKLKALMEAQKKTQQSQEKVVSIWDKVDFVLKAVLMPDAYSYLNSLKTDESSVYQRILNELVTPDVIQNIDYLIGILRQRGSVPRKIHKDIIILLERKVKGIKGVIKVKQGDGEMMDLGTYLTK